MHVTPSATLVKGGEIAYVGGTVIDTYTFEGAASCRFGDASIIDEEKMRDDNKKRPVQVEIIRGGKVVKSTIEATSNRFNGNKPGVNQARADADKFFTLPPLRQPVEA